MANKVRRTTAAAIVLITIATIGIRAQEAPGEAKGKAIGTAVKAALDVAFPPVKTIIDAIWPNPDKSKKGKDPDVKKAIQDARATSRALMIKQLSGVNRVVAELTLIDAFASNASKANPFIARVDAFLSASPTTADQWDDVERAWGSADIFLHRIADMKSEIVQKTIADESDQADILAFLDNLSVARNDATSFLKAHKASAMRDPVKRIAEALDGFRLKGAVRLGRLTTDLSSIPDALAAASEMSPPPPRLAPTPPHVSDDLQALVKARLTASQKQ